MRDRAWGRIVSVSSGLAHRVQPGLGADSASKAALLHLSRVMDAASKPPRRPRLRPLTRRSALRHDQLAQVLGADWHAGRNRADAARQRSEPGFVEPEESARLIRLAGTGDADDLAGDAYSIYEASIRTRLPAGSHG